MVYSFQPPRRRQVLWSPQGVLLIGRKAGMVHWVPSAAPQILSGRHLAFVKAPSGGLRVVDLGSTNGTYLGGRRLGAYEGVMVTLPSSVEIGSEGALRMEMRVSGT